MTDADAAHAPRVLAVLIDPHERGGIERLMRGVMTVSANTIEWQHVAVRPRNALSLREFMWQAVDVARRARRADPHVVIADRLHGLPFAYVAASLTRSRLVVWTHGSEVLSPSRRRVKRLMLQQADLVIANSSWTADVTAKLLASDERVSVVRPGVDPNWWRRPSDLSKSKLRSQHSLPLDDHLVLSVGRIARNARHKGFDRVAAAVSRLRAEGVKVTHVIAGDGDDRDWLRREISRVAAVDTVRWFRDLDDRQLRELYWLADSFALPSVPRHEGSQRSAEGFGIVFLEAAAAGLPALGTEHSGSRDAISPGVSGLYTDGSVTDIADRLRELVTHAVTFNPEGLAGWAEANSWRARSTDLAAIFKRIHGTTQQERG